MVAFQLIWLSAMFLALFWIDACLLIPWLMTKLFPTQPPHHSASMTLTDLSHVATMYEGTKAVDKWKTLCRGFFVISSKDPLLTCKALVENISFGDGWQPCEPGRTPLPPEGELTALFIVQFSRIPAPLSSWKIADMFEVPWRPMKTINI